VGMSGIDPLHREIVAALAGGAALNAVEIKAKAFPHSIRPKLTSIRLRAETLVRRGLLSKQGTGADAKYRQTDAGAAAFPVQP